MRRYGLLLAGLVVASSWSLATAQQEEVAEATADAVTRPAADKPDHPATLVQLELWVVNLGAEMTADQWDAASAEVATRDEVAKRVRRLQEEGLVTRSRTFKTLMVEGHEFTAHQGGREPRIQAVNQTRSGDQMNVTYESVGSMVSATTTLDPQGRVLCKLQIEESYLEDSEIPLQREGVSAILAPRIRTFTFQGMVACPAGAARIVMATTPGEKSDQSATIIFMAAREIE